MYFDYKTKTPIVEGGEGIIYEVDSNTLAKIYKPNVNIASKRKRIDALMAITLPPEVIKPIDTIEDRRGNLIGITMRKVDGIDIKMLSNKKYVISHNVTLKDSLKVLTRLWDVMSDLHSNGIYIGDLNDQNVLFDNHYNIYLIDTDSWSVGGENCTVAMDLFKDPLLKGSNFNAQTDTYAFCVLAWKTLTRVHPFGGTTNPDMQIMDRIANHISVIDRKIKLPRTTKDWVVLSPDLISAFKKVFESGDRVFGDYINSDYGNLAYCAVDKDYYFNGYAECPMCNRMAKLKPKQALQIGVENGFKFAKMLDDAVVKTVFDRYCYLDTNDMIVNSSNGNKYVYCGERFIFGSDYVVKCYRNRMVITTSHDTEVEIKQNSIPIIDNNILYYISPQNYLVKSVVMDSGIGRQPLGKCGIKSQFEVNDGHYCIVNIYDGNVIINIDGYNYTYNTSFVIQDVAMHRDSLSDKWLIIFEDTKMLHRTLILQKNSLVYSADNINYKCYIYNIAFNHGIIFMPVDGAIRAFNPNTIVYKDFLCDVVSAESKLIKNGNTFIIVNDDNVYRFYK